MRSEFHEAVSVLKYLPVRGVFNSHLLGGEKGQSFIFFSQFELQRAIEKF